METHASADLSSRDSDEACCHCEAKKLVTDNRREFAFRPIPGQ
jgi:hypothetical protein